MTSATSKKQQIALLIATALLALGLASSPAASGPLAGPVTAGLTGPGSNTTGGGG